MGIAPQGGLDEHTRQQAQDGAHEVSPVLHPHGPQEDAHQISGEDAQDPQEIGGKDPVAGGDAGGLGGFGMAAADVLRHLPPGDTPHPVGQGDAEAKPQEIQSPGGPKGKNHPGGHIEEGDGKDHRKGLHPIGAEKQEGCQGK